MAQLLINWASRSLGRLRPQMATDGGARCAGGTAHLPTAVPSAVAPVANPSLAHAPPLPPCCPSQAAGDELRSCARLGALLLAAGARPISGMLRPADRAALRDGQIIVGRGRARTSACWRWASLMPTWRPSGSSTRRRAAWPACWARHSMAARRRRGAALKSPPPRSSER